MQTDRQAAIFTTFTSADHAYSLNRVVQDQIKMLVYGGFKPTVFVEQGFRPIEAYALPEVKLVYLPNVPKSNEGILPADWEVYRDKMADALVEALQNVDVVLTHDLISQPAHIIHNLAARKVLDKFPKLRWLHWIHSVFSSNMPSNVWEASKESRSPFPNSFLVYPNSFDIPRLSANFGYEETDIKWVPHPTNVEEFFGMDEISARFVRDKKLLEPDVLLVYPCRLDRGKQPHYLIDLVAACKRNGMTAKVVFMDFHSTGGDKVVYRNEMLQQAIDLGIKDDVLFFSQYDKKYEYEAPHTVVRDLMMISNVFMMPSVSETYSLVAQEAILCGNFIILNHDFLPFRSIFGDLPKYYQFSANIGLNGMDGHIDTKYENKQEYFNIMAHYISYMITYDKVLALKTKFRKERNHYAVFEKFLRPLLFGE